ncbi:amino acid carrier protein [Treponema vincentii ATCC 35580]|uniref:Amino acid carrier protein n=1 Tax=Treponema vincentii ATCC 35580 TaxID=596324 RepID=C8PQ61_9SPIR|nr:alanine/glycine:cation symporter family protein [Treponema vincentii]EEV20437.1 amino acid carrier protein [Treponema vincentii ATCC 35580]
MLDIIGAIIAPINSLLYYPILIILLLVVGLYFTIRSKFLQVRLLGEAFRVTVEKPMREGDVSSFQTLMVTTASRVGTGNIVGVASAICLGGYGAVFWMWIVAIVGGASAFVEATLAQIYKKRDSEGGCYGGPSYYIQTALKSRAFGIIFAISLILTYAIGFNMLAAFNLQTSFAVYSFYNPSVTPWIIGAVLAAMTCYCLLGGGKRILKVTSVLVPIMGAIYVLVSLVMVVMNITAIPAIFARIFADAFNFKAIFGGVAGSCMMYGIKRGLYSNEAGIGSAPNAAATALISHPVKQGLVQMLSVFLDTLIICSATAFMCFSAGIEPSEALTGAPYVQAALSTLMGNFGNHFITLSLILFAFTTLLGNLYYVDNNLTYIYGKEPSKNFMLGYRIFASLVVLLGAAHKQALAWDIGDLLMGIMALINLPAIFLLRRAAINALKDYEKQRKEGKDPVFHAADIGITEKLDFWN